MAKPDALELAERLERYVNPRELIVGPNMMRDAMAEAAALIRAQHEALDAFVSWDGNRDDDDDVAAMLHYGDAISRARKLIGGEDEA